MYHISPEYIALGSKKAPFSDIVHDKDKGKMVREGEKIQEW